MTEKEKKAKVLFEGKTSCPYCKKGILVKKTKKLLRAATDAEYEEKVIAEKESQTKLTGKK